MLTGKDPGELGIYGFRERVHGTYDARIVDRAHVLVPRAQDLVDQAGYRTASLWVPPSHPLPSNQRRDELACFLSGADSARATPASLGRDLEAEFGSLHVDIEAHRSGSESDVFEQCLALMRHQMSVLRWIWKRRAPDLLCSVLIAPDRFHHAFWDAFDTSHPRYATTTQAKRQRFLDFYAELDREVGALLPLIDDQALLVLASDHGAKPLHGAFAINQWLVEKGFLALKAPVHQVTKIEPAMVDWSRSVAIADGGYCARIYLNRVGREPNGIVRDEEMHEILARLERGLLEIGGKDSAPWKTRVARPGELYRATRGRAPDLLVFLDDLGIRAAGTLGHPELHLPNNDTGFDTCNHDWLGTYVAAGPRIRATGRSIEREIYDVGATLLTACDVPQPNDWRGRSFFQVLDLPHADVKTR